MPNPSGGLKGIIQRTGQTLFSAGLIVRDYGTVAARWGYKIGGNMAFVMATTSMIVLMPLIFESTREVQMLENERIQVKELKNRGYSPRQLQEMGYSEAAMHSPPLAVAKKY